MVFVLKDFLKTKNTHKLMYNITFKGFLISFKTFRDVG